MSEPKQQRAQKIAGVKGMNDLLPSDAPLWEHFDNAVRSMLRAYGYQQIRTPIVEQTQLFVRGIGEVTDIVEKEMYSFTDSLNGEQLTMRPEGTAAAVRAGASRSPARRAPEAARFQEPRLARQCDPREVGCRDHRL